MDVPPPPAPFEPPPAPQAAPAAPTRLSSAAPTRSSSAASTRPPSAVIPVLLTAAVFIAYSIAQAVGAVIPAYPDFNSRLGLGLAVGTLIATPFGILMIWMLARRQADRPLREYLGLRWPTIGQTLLWTAALFLVGTGYEALSRWLDRPAVPDFMLQIVRTAVYPSLLWLAVVVAAPIFEEILFRGYLFEGLRRSRLGAVGAVLLSSLLFALPHLQYDLFDISSVLALGLVFGLARWRSGSTYLPIALHILSNGLSMAQMSEITP
jgi:membrane protease YdiL (CAAX protease family)